MHCLISIISLFAFTTVLPRAMAVEAPEQQPLQCSVEFNNAIVPANRHQRAIARIALDAPEPQRDAERPALNLSLVLDRSGSMQGVKMEQAKRAVLTLVGRMSATDYFSLVTCNSRVETIIPARSAGDSGAIADAVHGIQAGGETSLFSGLCQGASEIRRHLDRSQVNRIILISDGAANRGPRSARELGRLGASLLKENIAVTTIGLGDQFNEDLMTQLSELSDGNTYYAPSAGALPAILQQEVDRLLSIAANRVRVNVACLDGTRPIRIIGRQGQVVGNQVQFDLNQLYGGQPNYMLLEISVPPGSAQQRREVLQVQCRYEEPVTRQEAQVVADASIGYSNSPKDILRGNNKRVQRDYNRNSLAMAQETAIELIDQGQQGQAAQVLNDNMQIVNAWAVANDDPKLLEKTKQIEQQLEKVGDGGLSQQQRKVWKSESVQIRTQQIDHPPDD